MRLGETTTLQLLRQLFVQCGVHGDRAEGAVRRRNEMKWKGGEKKRKDREINIEWKWPEEEEEETDGGFRQDNKVNDEDCCDSYSESVCVCMCDVIEDQTTGEHGVSSCCSHLVSTSASGDLITSCQLHAQVWTPPWRTFEIWATSTLWHWKKGINHEELTASRSTDRRKKFPKLKKSDT